jgi:hypothetical protein
VEAVGLDIAVGVEFDAVVGLPSPAPAVDPEDTNEGDPEGAPPWENNPLRPKTRTLSKPMSNTALRSKLAPSIRGIR